MASFKEVVCVFCLRKTPTRLHHLIPRSLGGVETVAACQSCECFIHQNWSHKELRDVFNSVDKITQTEKFKKFKKWLLKQKDDIVFSTRPAKEVKQKRRKFGFTA